VSLLIYHEDTKDTEGYRFFVLFVSSW